jgi:predicted mannosyl-3-phosphoglycerate phosphatase (HAD superfamily)
MQMQATGSPTSAAASFGGDSAAMVVFTAIDGALCDFGTSAWREAQQALALLASRQVPVVLISGRPAAGVLALQQQLGFVQPFICRGGAEVHVPRGYFTDLQDLWPADEAWHVISIGAPEPGRAVRVLTLLFRSGGETLTVGLGSTWADRLFLADVDVPIIVAGQRTDEQRLQRHLPGAFVTTAVGCAGWRAVILGLAPA